MSKSLFCTQPPSRQKILATFLCFSVHSSFVFFRSKTRAGSNHIPSFPSFNSSCSCFAAHFFQWADLVRFNGIFSTSFGQTYLMSTLVCPSNIKGVPKWPFDAQSTGLAHHPSCWTSRLPPRLDFKKPDSSHLFFGSTGHVRIHTPFCPSLNSHSRELFFHFQAKCFQEKGQRGRALFNPLLLPSASSI